MTATILPSSKASSPPVAPSQPGQFQLPQDAGEYSVTTVNTIVGVPQPTTGPSNVPGVTGTILPSVDATANMQAANAQKINPSPGHPDHNPNYAPGAVVPAQVVAAI